MKINAKDFIGLCCCEASQWILRTLQNLQYRYNQTRNKQILWEWDRLVEHGCICREGHTLIMDESYTIKILSAYPVCGVVYESS